MHLSMSDRFTREKRPSAPRRGDGDLALRAREEMRTAVSNVRAGLTAEVLSVDEGPRAPDRSSAEHEPRFVHVDVHHLH